MNKLSKPNYTRIYHFLSRIFPVVVASLIFLYSCEDPLSTRQDKLVYNEFTIVESNSNVKIDTYGKGMVSYDVNEYYIDHNNLVQKVIQEDAILPPAALPHTMQFLMKYDYRIEPENCVAVFSIDGIPDSILSDSTYYFVLKKRTVTFKDRVEPLPIEDMPLEVSIDTIYNSVYVHTHGDIEFSE